MLLVDCHRSQFAIEQPFGSRSTAAINYSSAVYKNFTIAKESTSLH